MLWARGFPPRCTAPWSWERFAGFTSPASIPAKSFRFSTIVFCNGRFPAASVLRCMLSSILPRTGWLSPTQACHFRCTPPTLPASLSEKVDSSPACFRMPNMSSTSSNFPPEIPSYSRPTDCTKPATPKASNSLVAQCESKSATESLDHLFDGLHAFSNGTLPHDDITAAVLKVLP